MAIYIAGGNQKGGVGKTTMLVSLAGELSKRGRRVLMVDFDPQGHATLWLRGKSDGHRTVDAFVNRQALRRCIVKSKHPGIDVLPGGERFVELNYHLMLEMVVGDIQQPIQRHVFEHLKFAGVVPALARQYHESVQVAIKRAFRTEAADLEQAIDIRSALRHPDIDEAYEYVLIDCGPTATNLMGETLSTVDAAMCISVPSGLGADGTSQYLDTIAAIKNERNPQLDVLGILLNNYHREKSETEYIDAFRDNWGDLVLDTVMPHDAMLMRASSGFRLNAISYYARKSKITRIVAELTDEFLARVARMY